MAILCSINLHTTYTVLMVVAFRDSFLWHDLQRAHGLSWPTRHASVGGQRATAGLRKVNNRGFWSVMEHVVDIELGKKRWLKKRGVADVVHTELVVLHSDTLHGIKRQIVVPSWHFCFWHPTLDQPIFGLMLHTLFLVHACYKYLN